MNVSAPLCAAALTAGLGIGGLIAPARMARFVGIEAVGARGISEIRATYGGFFLAMGGACIASPSPTANKIAAAAWIGAAAARVASILFDRAWSATNAGGVLLEAAIGALFAAGAC